MTQRGLMLFCLVAALGAGCSSYVSGAMHAQGGSLGTWQMIPNTCVSGFHHGVPGAEIYRRGAREDTEVVLVDSHDEGLEVLLRIPGENRMARLRPDECKRFQPRLDFNGSTVNGAPGVMGSLNLDCDIPQLGRVQGSFIFNCY